MLSPMTGGIAEVNGARLWYEVAGSGRAVVLLHGHLIDSGQWDDQFPLYAREFRVARYDARGFGRSDQPEGPFSFSEDLHGLMGALGIERAALVGCSGGGATVVDLALAHPEMVEALVLVGSGLAGFRFTGEVPADMVAHRRAMEAGDVGRAVEASLRFSTDGGRRPDQVDPAARERTRAMMVRQLSRPRVTAEARWVDPPAASRLAEIRAPVMVLVGDHDNVVVRDIADLVTREVPGARREVIPDAGHHPNMEHPALFDELVLGFLRGMK